LVDNFVALEVVSKQKIELSEEGAEYATRGTPEYQYTNVLVLNESTPKEAIEAKVFA
jgi:hypothetical protein